MANAQSLTPVQPGERIEVLDILRGFALFGILLVNMDLFINPIQSLLRPVTAGSSQTDLAVSFFVKFIGEGKFYSLFSFLFGYGFAILFLRSEEKGISFKALVSRRFFVLLLIGLIHAYLIWVGDILFMYSLLGFLLILFRKSKPKTLLIWAFVLLALPILLLAVGTLAIEAGKNIPEAAEQINNSFAEQTVQYQNDIERAYKIYPTGNFMEITQQRAYDMKFMISSMLFLALPVFAMFLIGLYFGKRQLLHNISENTVLWKKLFVWGLIFGIIGNLVFASLILSLERFVPSFNLLFASLGQTIGALALCFFFISAFALYLNSDKSNKNYFAFLSPVGRMALTNYLMQSIICTMIFYGYGLGQFGQISKSEGLLLVVVIFFFQMILSNWWINRMKLKYGPVEWLWRKLTYFKKF